ncbi:MAG: hypothetical protein SF053_07300 [Bacteroidia bacterium]|nr:hypothetical protein [Bacteroidia bacterium]
MRMTKNVGTGMLIAVCLVAAMTGCQDPCDPTLNPGIGDEYFTVTYLSPAGTNYLTSTYNPAGIVVYLDSTGGADPTPDYKLIRPGYTGGAFGPFAYTGSFISAIDNRINFPLLFQRNFAYDYYIKKDTYGVDTLRVEFLLGADECNYFWSYIRYYHNGDRLTQYDNQPKADIVITE